jgi:uncharacterized protein DUF3307
VIDSLGLSLPLAKIVSVYLLFRIKHLMADYLLQTTWMARGKEQAVGWAGALCAHAAVHASGTTAIALAFAPSLWWLGVVDFVLHAMIDKSKTLWGPRQPSEPVFWWAHGIDQEAHHLTHFAFVIAIVLA